MLSACAVCLAVVWAAALAVPAGAQDALFVRPSTQPLAGQPFELFFAGSWMFYFDPPTPEPEVLIDGQVIEIGVLAFGRALYTPIRDYAFGVPVAGLPEGEYEVRLVLGEVGLGLPPIFVYPLTVRAPRLTIEPVTQPLLEGEVASLRITAVESVKIDAEDRSVVVTTTGPGTFCGIILPCLEGPDYALSVDLGVLDPGAWDLEVVYGGPGGSEVLLSRGFHVFTGFEIIVPEVQLVDILPVDLLVRGAASCPSLNVESVSEGLVELRVDVCPIGVPPAPEAFEFPVSLDLEAGTYRVVLRGPYDDSVRYDIGLEVVAVPVPLGPEGRYQASVTWTDFAGQQGIGLPARPPSDDSALFWFFGPENWELMIKVLDGCGINGHVWVFGAATTTVGYELRVVDTLTGAEWTYDNPLGRASEAITDIEAFPCDP